MTNTQRIKTGVPGLDELLGGGLLPGRSLLIKGPPGSGKTTLGMQMLIDGAKNQGQPGLLLTFEHQPEQLCTDAAGFGWDVFGLAHDQRLRLICIRPEQVLEQPGRQENRLLTEIEDWAQDVGARRILIDSLSHIRSLYTGEQARAQFLNFVQQLKAIGLTPIFTAEMAGEKSEGNIDAYLADSVIEISYDAGGEGRAPRRGLTIVKTRGHSHIGGFHPLEIGAGGIVVYPHIYSESEEDLERNADVLSTGIPGLDSLLGGGYGDGSRILVAGLSGTLKTCLSAHFLAAGIAKGEPGLCLKFDKRSTDKKWAFQAFQALDVDMAEAFESKMLTVLQPIPGQDSIEKIILQAEAAIDEHKIKRVAIDSMTDLISEIEDGRASREAIQWMLRRLADKSVTTLYTQLLSRAPGRNPLSEIEWAELSDTIIYLGIVEIESRLEKVVSVLKHSGSNAESDLRAVYFTPDGIEISDRFVGLSGVLSGNAMGKRKAKIESLFQPLFFIRDFLAMARNPSLSDERRDKVLANLSEQTESLIQAMSRHFDEPLEKPSKSDEKEA